MDDKLKTMGLDFDILCYIFIILFFSNLLCTYYMYIFITQFVYYNWLFLSLQNESEIVPFPNKEMEFCLPQSDFSTITEQEFPRVTQLVVSADSKDSKEPSKEG